MNEPIPLKGEAEPTAERRTHYRRLFRKFILLTVVCSLLPLLLAGWGIYFHYTRFARSKMNHFFQTQLEHHRRIIELFLEDRCMQLQMVAYTHTKESLIEGSKLQDVFDLINRDHPIIEDIGVIDDRGNHLAYVGPYDLMDKKYSETFWFKQVMEKGVYISDMFMGFREVPHFIIAVVRAEGSGKWILRTTIDTEAFRSLVENVRIGKTGEVYLLNQEGIFQTSPRFSGKIMAKAPLSMEPVHEGIRIFNDGLDSNRKQIICQAWLRDPPWLLVVKQDYSEAFESVNHANRSTLLFLHLGALIILVVTVWVTRHMVTVIKKRDAEADGLNKQLLQASKLAAIGELSAGVAHEINNPLAIILTEKQILMDMIEQGNGDLSAQIPDSMRQIDIQVQRCKRITQNLLRFSRRTRSIIETVNINRFIREIVDLMEREARSGGIRFITDLEESLPPILSDPSQLQQVFLNLITNAIDAHDEKRYGSIHIRTHSSDTEGVEVAVADTGVGIPPENLEKIFDPFFTTKSVGKGTGLGLSICYSSIKGLGGHISVRSEVGKGTEFTLHLPLRPPQALMAGEAEDAVEERAIVS